MFGKLIKEIPIFISVKKKGNPVRIDSLSHDEPLNVSNRLSRITLSAWADHRATTSEERITGVYFVFGLFAGSNENGNQNIRTA